jgi:hypothetical protein
VASEPRTGRRRLARAGTATLAATGFCQQSLRIGPKPMKCPKTRPKTLPEGDSGGFAGLDFPSRRRRSTGTHTVCTAPIRAPTKLTLADARLKTTRCSWPGLAPRAQGSQAQETPRSSTASTDTNQKGSGWEFEFFPHNSCSSALEFGMKVCLRSLIWMLVATTRGKPECGLCCYRPT